MNCVSILWNKSNETEKKLKLNLIMARALSLPAHFLSVEGFDRIVVEYVATSLLSRLIWIQRNYLFGLQAWLEQRIRTGMSSCVHNQNCIKNVQNVFMLFSLI